MNIWVDKHELHPPIKGVLISVALLWAAFVSDVGNELHVLDSPWFFSAASLSGQVPFFPGNTISWPRLPALLFLGAFGVLTIGYLLLLLPLVLVGMILTKGLNLAIGY